MSKSKHPLIIELRRISKTEARFAGITLFLSALFFLAQWTGGEDEMMLHFKIHYKAGRDFLEGWPIYGKAFAGGSDTLGQSPFFVMCMIPLSMLTFKLAAAIYFMGISLIFTWIILFLRRMTKHYFGMGKELKALSMLIFVLVFIDMYTDELQIGGIHILVLGLMCMMFKFLVSRQYMYVGMVYAVIVMLYPHMIGLVPLFLLRMRFKAMIVAACALVVLLFLPVIFVGWETLIGYLADWKMSIVNQHIDLLHEKNTIHYIISEFFFDPFGYEGTESLIAFNVVAVGLGILALAITNIRLKRRYFSLMFFEVFLFLAIIPNMVHGTSGQFILSMPIIWFLLLSCFQKFEGKLIVITVAALIMVPWLFTSTDFVGFKMKALIDESGLLGLANLVFLVLATYVFITRRNMVVKKFSRSSWK